MTKIRSVKFELLHECLYEAERRRQLPLRLFMLGLYTFCDEEARFCWQPNQLKFDITPHDNLDFAQTFDVLAKCGLVLKYEVKGKTYGYIPSRRKHQCINSALPAQVDPDLLSSSNNEIH